MSSFKLFWNIHKWTGLTLALVFACSAVTGFGLLIKKRVAWIMPPTMTGADGTADDLITVQEVLAAVFAQNHPDFQDLDDIDRIDFRPRHRVHKVHSEHHHAEMQIDAITGDMLSIGTRRSDFLENVHDGSFYGAWVHTWIMPAAAASLLCMTGSGFWLWIEPKLRRRRRRKGLSRR